MHIVVARESSYLDKQRSHPLARVVVSTDAVDHADRVYESGHALLHIGWAALIQWTAELVKRH